MSVNPGGTPLPTTDAPAASAVTEVNTLIQDGESAAEAAIIAAEPVMNTPVLKALWEAVLDALVNYIFKPLIDNFTGKIVVDLQEYMNLKAAVAAQANLDAVKQTGDASAISQASAQVDSAVAAVAHYIGDTKPTS